MLKQLLVSGVFALVLSAGMSAEVVVKRRPPAAVVEHRPAAPGPGYVWVAGYQKWDGNHYAWVPGSWSQPPRPGARWEAHRWLHRKDGWVFVEGKWR